MRNCTAVMSGEAFLQVCRISYVVMCLCGYIGENINIEKGHNKGSRIRMMVRCSTIWRSPTSFRRFRHTPLLRLRTTPWHFLHVWPGFVPTASPYAAVTAWNYAVAFFQQALPGFVPTASPYAAVTAWNYAVAF